MDVVADHNPQKARGDIVDDVGRNRDLEGRVGPDREKKNEEDKQFPEPLQIEILRIREVLPQRAVVGRDGVEELRDHPQGVGEGAEDVEVEDDIRRVECEQRQHAEKRQFVTQRPAPGKPPRRGQFEEQEGAGRDGQNIDADAKAFEITVGNGVIDQQHVFQVEQGPEKQNSTQKPMQPPFPSVGHEVDAHRQQKTENYDLRIKTPRDGHYVEYLDVHGLDLRRTNIRKKSDESNISVRRLCYSGETVPADRNPVPERQIEAWEEGGSPEGASRLPKRPVRYGTSPSSVKMVRITHISLRRFAPNAVPLSYGKPETSKE